MFLEPTDIECLELDLAPARQPECKDDNSLSCCFPGMVVGCLCGVVTVSILVALWQLDVHIWHHANNIKLNGNTVNTQALSGNQAPLEQQCLYQVFKNAKGVGGGLIGKALGIILG